MCYIECLQVPPPSHLRGKKWSGSWMVRTHLLECSVKYRSHFYLLLVLTSSTLSEMELRPCLWMNENNFKHKKRTF